MKAFLNNFVLLFILLLSTSLGAQLTYENISDQVGLGQFGGLTDCIVDMNGDYLDDIVTVNNSEMSIFFQQIDGSFEKKTIIWNFNTLPTWSICAGDFNEDGVNDLILGDYGSVSFYLSVNGGETYVEETFPEYIFAQRSSASDIDQDGHLDAFVCNDDAQNHVYRNMGDGIMELDISLLPTADMAGNYANIWTDYDNDGDQDLFITKCYVFTTSVNDPERVNLLYQNNGDGTFTEVGASANMNDNAQSWITSMEDFDNDGDFDAFIANHDFANRFMMNNGDGTFTDIIDSTGIDKNDLGAWQSFAGDFNNDGFVDIMMDTERKIYINNGDLTFRSVSVPMGEYNRGAVGDLNNDGHLDFIFKNNVWLNTSSNGNWFKVNLKGIVSNSNGIGSRIELHGEWGMQSREIRSGESYSSMSHLNAHFGIGEATSIDSLVIKWPSGLRSTIESPPINSTQMVFEYDCLIDDVVVAYTGTLELCPGEQLIMNAPPGFDSYLWSNGETTEQITVTEEGSYFVEVTSSDGCFGVNTPIYVIAVDDNAPTISQVGLVEICTGESLIVTAEVGQDDILWNNESTQAEITISEAGEYYVQSTSLCTGETLVSETLELVILEPALPIVVDVIITPGESATLIAEGDNLYWYENIIGGNPIALGNTYITPTLDMETTYYVENRIENDNVTCKSMRVPVLVGLTGTEEIIQELGIDIYPNPATTNINIDIDSPSEVYSVELVNSLGQSVDIIGQDNIGQQELTFDVSLLTNGNYTIKMFTSKGMASRSVFVRN